MADCAAIVLAAGESSRLGNPKQLVTVSSETLLRRTVRFAVEAGCAPVIAVLGYESEKLLGELNGLDAVAVLNEDWREGMATSVHRGLDAALLVRPDLPAAMLLVCDQPALSADLVKRLSLEYAASGKSIAASRYSSTLGVPAIFGSRHFPALRSLSGEQGARRIIHAQIADVHPVEFPEGALDIDNQEDLVRAGLYSAPEAG